MRLTRDESDARLMACVLAAYTMFNVYLPKLLETRSTSNDPSGAPKSLEDSLWDVVIYSIGGCPGAIVSLAPRSTFTSH